MSDIQIQVGDQTSEIHVRARCLGEVGVLLRGVGASGQVCLVTDRRVGGLYGDEVEESLRSAKFDVQSHTIEPGESSKSLGVLESLYTFLGEQQLDREGTVLALGGGVVSDLAGFAAATWLRGVRFAVCPTTLEADIDAAIGGKTAINIAAGKNLVGAFHQPALVAIDPLCLSTLDPRDIRAGLAESVKHALISTEEFLNWHEDHHEPILALEPKTTVELVLRNLRIKADVVREDAHERTGRRMTLNFGHTLGHAIEACCGFRLRHGECVALGMVAACRLSRDLGLLEDAVVDRTTELLSRLGLDTELNEAIDPDQILSRMRNDKKARDGKIRFVLLEAIGQPVIRDDITETQMLEAYRSLLP